MPLSVGVLVAEVSEPGPTIEHDSACLCLLASTALTASSIGSPTTAWLGNPS
ncbi:MAG: hypothetical protein I4O49_09865 [Janthinobacterium lividum]|nr:hypothetical protein [Janthinobacterium lividum]